ncbi:hypothetical protein N7470_005808 [Penicillium chermesinum]|nr:hypothetical protein N7470_005808 [Penicillium chermesinum]
MPDLSNIQGDVWPRLPKKAEGFYFFNITNPAEFKKHLKRLAPQITTGEEAKETRSELYSRKKAGKTGLVQLSSINISFSYSGLEKLGKTDLGDEIFRNGQYKDMVTDGLDKPEDWDKFYQGYNGKIDGVILVTGNTLKVVESTFLKSVQPCFSSGGPTTSMRVVHTEEGTVQQHDKEHFGWVDGISEPLVKGLESSNNPKDLPPVRDGTFFVGGEGDFFKSPAWAKDGSFMVFRRLRQLVPEFTSWCGKNCEDPTNMDVIRLFSSRVDGHPEDPKNKRNDFDFGPDNHLQTRCPFAAHIRKVRPRADFANDSQAMIRRGIPYGDWTEVEEKRGGHTLKHRGLLFVSYQANLRNGFRFVMKEWANKDGFPDGKFEACGGKPPGIDPIIGQVDKYPGRCNIPSAKNLQPAPPVSDREVEVERFVIPEGGEYFFTPSINALMTDLTK